MVPTRFRRVLVSVSERTTDLIGWTIRNRSVPLPQNGKPVCINLGCGLTVADGWVNVDGSLNALISAQPTWVHAVAYRLSGASEFYSLDYYRSTLAGGDFVFQDLSHGRLPFPSSCADFVFSSHFIEHLEKDQAERLIADCNRVLRHGGTIRLGVPDLAIAWEMYRRGEKERMLHDYFFCGDRRYSRHKYAYDFDMMRRLLESAGFTDVRQEQFRRGRTPDLDILDNREDYTLFVEATAT